MGSRDHLLYERAKGTDCTTHNALAGVYDSHHATGSRRALLFIGYSIITTTDLDVETSLLLFPLIVLWNRSELYKYREGGWVVADKGSVATQS